MTAPFSDELISAYLDGELTASEQEYVEAQLRENADLRRMCDELRALRMTLRAMPVAEPPENLVERILRQAERRMLSGDQALADIPSAAAAIPSVAPTQVFRNWRVALAVVATLAASVLAILWLPWHTGQDVAQAPLAAPSLAAPSLAAPSLAAPSLAAAIRSSNGRRVRQGRGCRVRGRNGELRRESRDDTGAD